MPQSCKPSCFDPLTLRSFYHTTHSALSLSLSVSFSLFHLHPYLSLHRCVVQYHSLHFHSSLVLYPKIHMLPNTNLPPRSLAASTTIVDPDARMCMSLHHRSTSISLLVSSDNCSTRLALCNRSEKNQKRKCGERDMDDSRGERCVPLIST